MIAKLIVWVQVLGEMLPISSSTQVDLAVRWWGLHGDVIPKGFEALLYMPLLFVVAVFFRKSWTPLVVMMWGRWCRRERVTAWSMRRLLAIAGKLMGIILGSCVLAAGVELLAKKAGGLVGMRPLGLLVTAALLFAAARIKSSPVVAATHAWLVLCCVGAAQSLAFIPGVSRMGVTICVALLLGMTVRRAFEFSFALEFPLAVAMVVVRGLPWLLAPEAATWMTVDVVVHVIGAGMVSYGVLWGAQQIFMRGLSWVLAVYVLGCAGVKFFY